MSANGRYLAAMLVTIAALACPGATQGCPADGCRICGERSGCILCPPAPLASPPPPPQQSPPPGGAVPSGTMYKGQATAFSPAVTNGKAFSCPYNTLSAWQRVYFAAINVAQWDGGRQCGKCVMARCVDPRCKVKNKWVTVHLIDQCPDCARGDVDFSSPSFLELTGLTPDRVKVEWVFTSCRLHVQGGIRLDPKDKDFNKYWQGVYLYNSAEPITKVAINGRPLALQNWGFWVHDGLFNKGQPHTLSITSESGRTISTTITNIWTAQQLPIHEQGDEMIHHPALGSPLAPTPEDLSLHGATLDAACAAAIANTGGADNPFGAAAHTWRPSVDLGPRKMSQDPERAVSGVAINDLVAMTSDPKVHRRLELHSSAHTGRLSRRDILAVLTSEISAKTKLRWGLAIGGVMLVLCLAMLAANAGLTYAVVAMSKETQVESSGAMLDRATHAPVGTASTAGVIDLLTAYRSSPESAAAILGLQQLLVTTPTGMAAYRVFSVSVKPGVAAEFVVAAPADGSWGAAGTAPGAAPGVEMMRIVIDDSGVHEVRSGAADAAGARRRMLAAGGGAVHGVVYAVAADWPPNLAADWVGTFTRKPPPPSPPPPFKPLDSRRAGMEAEPAEPQAPADSVAPSTTDVAPSDCVPSATEMTATEAATEPEAASGAGKKRKIAMFLAYVGHGYQGMQRNPGAKTIEDELFRALHAAGGISDANADDNGFIKVHWMRAARTDKGVSAVGQVVSLKMVLEPEGCPGGEGLLQRINDKLPAQIRVFGYSRVTNGFDSRKHCDKRRYEYVLPEWAFDPRRGVGRSAALAASRSESAAAEAAAAGDEQQQTAAADADQQQQQQQQPTEAATAQPQEQADGAADGAAAAGRPARADGLPGAAADQRPAADGTAAAPEVGAAADEAAAAGGAAAIDDGPFVLDEARQNRLTAILSNYQGTHNFHNYTVRKAPTALDVKRYILSFKCKGVFEIKGERWVKLVVIGQSFMLHQIRKMVGMAVAVMRGSAPEECMKLALKSSADLNTPMAPELGLFLEECYFDGYNKQWSHVHHPLSLGEYQADVDAFKGDRLYPHIAARDAADGVNEAWLRTLNEANYRFGEWAAHVEAVRQGGGRRPAPLKGAGTASMVGGMESYGQDRKRPFSGGRGRGRGGRGVPDKRSRVAARSGGGRSGGGRSGGGGSGVPDGAAAAEYSD
ncbi:tRNA pseudouridine synthase mitochondrial-like [Micractinium conductrix]|uniref:tRNA pseudouridine synthase mitochondrial-like n=1 Tax=Micractinium conductrix TaxID=554055 RepID=A0A2P6VLQ7_9CHLO|nr:tRNA pseudouridine synthase mitochondrial-like [Micractinium conductrix]|eukprot:PSC75036.1 tRNA pseudouridine synthase mitochondrial-like [Micractinium conductrix]